MTTTTPNYFPGYAVPRGTYSAPPVQRTSRTRVLLIWFSAIAVVAVALIGVTMMMSKPPARYYVPAQLRAAADGYTGGDQSPVHRARRRVLGVVSRRGVGVQDHHQTQWGDSGSAGRRRRHAAAVQRACGEPVTGADR